MTVVISIHISLQCIGYYSYGKHTLDGSGNKIQSTLGTSVKVKIDTKDSNGFSETTMESLRCRFDLMNSGCKDRDLCAVAWPASRSPLPLSHHRHCWLTWSPNRQKASTFFSRQKLRGSTLIFWHCHSRENLFSLRITTVYPNVHKIIMGCDIPMN